MHRNKFAQFGSIILLLTFQNCRNPAPKDHVQIDIGSIKISSEKASDLENDSIQSARSAIDTIYVLVLPSANGYDYGTYNFDFNPIIEQELGSFANIIVKPFPYKSLMGTTYLGVFDRKDCHAILEKVDVDYLILTRFAGPFKRVGMKWG